MDQAVINEEMIQTIRRVREAAAVAEKLEKEKESVAQDKKFEVKVELPSDQDGEASETENKSAPLDELTLDNDNDDENRNKRCVIRSFKFLDNFRTCLLLSSSSDSCPLAAALQLVDPAVAQETFFSTLSE